MTATVRAERRAGSTAVWAVWADGVVEVVEVGEGTVEVVISFSVGEAAR